MNLLNKILDYKKQEIELAKKNISIRELVDSNLYHVERRSLKKSLIQGSGIIAEYKRQSPSAGIITKDSLEDVLTSYQINNASAFSILTDKQFFGGSLEDLQKARTFGLPILRKDFIIDEYQLFEAKANGADAVLLIAEILDAYHGKYLCQIAQSIGLEVVMEFHTASELHKIPQNVDIIGVNNRNLDTLETKISNGIELIKQLPINSFKIAESGIKTVDEIHMLYSLGFNGCLIGEHLLKDDGFKTGLKKIKLKSCA